MENILFEKLSQAPSIPIIETNQYIELIACF